jgi:hypothetical protein
MRAALVPMSAFFLSLGDARDARSMAANPCKVKSHVRGMLSACPKATRPNLVSAESGFRWPETADRNRPRVDRTTEDAGV